MPSIAKFRSIVADTLTVNVGTATGGIADTQIWQDGNEIVVADAAATPGLTITVTFEDVDSILYLFVLGFYEGSSTHYVNIEMWNYDTAAWDQFGNMALKLSSASHLLPVLDDTDYISGGQAKARFNHPPNGNVNHDTTIRFLALLY